MIISLRMEVPKLCFAMLTWLMSIYRIYPLHHVPLNGIGKSCTFIGILPAMIATVNFTHIFMILEEFLKVSSDHN